MKSNESPPKTYEVIQAWKKTPESHTTPAMSSEPMSTEEPLSIMQPSETVTPVKPTERNQKADAQVVKDPEAVRNNARNTVIFMNDQIPMWLKLKPGKQVYAEFETRKGHYERNLGRLSGGLSC